jgi:alpha-mannosidase
VISESLTLRHKAQSSLISHRVKDDKKHDEDQQGVIVFNTLPWSRSEVIVSPEKSIKWSNQQWNGEYEYLLVEDVPGLGASGYVASNESDFKTVSSEKAATGKSF